MPRPAPDGLDDALARAGDGVFVLGADGRIASWNRAAERILGHAARDVMGKQCCDVFVGRDDRGNRLCYRGCHVVTLTRMGEAVQSFDMRTTTKTGTPVWLNFSILTLGGAGGTIVHLFRDVTASKELLALVAERLSRPTTVPPDAGAELTRRELEVLRLVATGANTKAIAAGLHVSTATVRNHVQNLFGKLGVHSRLEAAALANRRGLT
jgi:PAS domain S-box-containing protein